MRVWRREVNGDRLKISNRFTLTLFANGATITVSLRSLQAFESAPRSMASLNLGVSLRWSQARHRSRRRFEGCLIGNYFIAFFS